MSSFDSQLKELKQFAKAICDKNDVSFCGIFHNSNKNFEKTIIVGNTISSLSELNYSNSILNNLSINSLPNELQPNLSYLLKPIETTPPSTSIATGTLSSSSSSSSKHIIKEYKMINIDPNNTLEVKNYLYNCFEEFQQIPCKLLSKAWIKLVEPRKQSKYPYKQGDLTKPYWWPSNARHKEPDHLKKDERINLLISILRVFKHREPELIHSASTINELSPSNKLTNTGDEFGSRKLEILGDMFRVVKCQLEFDRNTIRVIKPGKKYSSQIYQKQNQKKPYNNVNFDNTTFSHSSLLSNGSGCNEGNNNSNNEEEIRIAQILATPTNHQSNHFNDLTQYFSNRSTFTSNLQNDYPSALKQPVAGEYNSLLSSPFTPNQATTIMMTKNTSVSEIDENGNHNNSNSNSNIKGLSNSNNNIISHNIDPKFLIPPQISTNKQSLNSSPLSSILYSRNMKDNRGNVSSSPSSIFNKAINQHSGILSSLSPSHLNVMKIPPSLKGEVNKNHRVTAKGNNSNGLEIGSEDTIILPNSQL